MYSLRTLFVVVGMSVLSACTGNPFGPFAGGQLSAPQSEDAFAAWNDVVGVDTIFIETRQADPYSVQTWVVAVDERLFAPTSLIMGDSQAEERTWVQNIIADPAVRVQIGDAVYPMHAYRVSDRALHQTVLEAFQKKYAGELPEIDDHAANAWIFELAAR